MSEALNRPGFLIIGAQKAGTKALYVYLSEHPELTPSFRKEIHFFDNDTNFLGRGESWYHSQFPPSSENPEGVRFEATPDYLYCPMSPQRIYDYCPTIKLVALLRDPVERAYSAWNMYRAFGGPAYPHPMLRALKETRTFSEAVADELASICSGDFYSRPGHVSRGLYHMQLMRYLHFFGRERILILHSRELREHVPRTLNEVTRFLDLPKHVFTESKLFARHVGMYHEPIPQKTRKLLSQFYRPYNGRLYALVGRDLGWQ